ncbi:hypothetical protein GGD52_000826 [Agrobacterium tumefaciens]|nr:hypothetical protein [Agrobacterium radiobacter]MBB5586269.1 hypothetical protein [Agrobacterium radiobacter]
MLLTVCVPGNAWGHGPETAPTTVMLRFEILQHPMYIS